MKNNALSDKPETYHTVILQYDSYFYPRYDEIIQKRLGYPSGSGMGMGIRDHSWVFKTKKGAENFFKKAKLKLRGFKIQKDLYSDTF